MDIDNAVSSQPTAPTAQFIEGIVYFAQSQIGGLLHPPKPLRGFANLENVMKGTSSNDEEMRMPPAARVGDMTSHGTSLGPGPGSFNVLIGGMPAWRVTADFHTCPLVSATVPHVGGVVVVGSATVLINNLPAARQGDMIVESGPPNSIVMGCPTVMVG